MGHHQATQLRRHRKRDQKVHTGQQPVELRLQPLLRLVMLASRAVAVAARTEVRAIPSPRTITLLNLVSELVEKSANESELVASVMDLVNRGGVRLIGQVVEPDLLNH